MDKVLIDTHFLLWLLFGADKLEKFPWLKTVKQLLVSPLSILELRYLIESKKMPINLLSVLDRLKKDEKLVMDDVSFEKLCLSALDISWTRDVFDRLLVAHSQLKGIPLATNDRKIRENYPNVI